MVLLAVLGGGASSCSSGGGGGGVKQCSVDADCSANGWCQSGSCQAPYQLAIVEPNASTATRGTLQIRVQVTGGQPPVQLELVNEGRLPGGLIGPPDYALAWDTAATNEGIHRLKATVGAGTRTYESQVVEVLVDRTPPTAPVPNPIASPTSANPVVISGTAEEKTTLTILDDGRSVAQLEVPNGGAWTANLGLAEGSHNLTATATDAAGNASAASAPALPVLVDRTAPPAPHIDELPATSPAAQLTMTGTAEAGSTVVVSAAGVERGRTTATGGTWTIVLHGLIDGHYAFAAVAIDGAGNASPASAPVNLTVDSTIPFVVFGTVPSITNANPLVVTGTATLGSLVRLTEGATELGQVRPDATQVWALSLTLAPGSHVLTATATSTTGAVSPAVQVTVQIDRTAPTVISRSPTPADPDAWSRTPIVALFSKALKGITVNDGTVTLTGAGATAISKTVHLSDDGLELTITPVQPPSLPNTFVVTLTSGITDLAGNALQIPAGAWSWTVNLWQTLPSPTDLGPWSVGMAGPPPMQFAMKIGSDRNPILAYCVATTSPAPKLSRWNGSSWQQIVALATPCDWSMYGQLAFDMDAGGRFALAWGGVDAARTPELLYASVIGASVPVETPQASSVFDHDMRFNSTGALFVAWNQGYPGHAFLRRWNGSSWEPLGTGQINPASDDANNTRIWFGSDGNPVVNWYVPATGGAYTGRARRWTGSAWEDVQTWQVATSGDVFSGAFAVATTEPVVAYVDRSATPYQARVVAASPDRYGQYRWLARGGSLNLDPAQDAASTAVALDPAADPVVAWTEGVSTGGSQLHVKRWTSAGWTTIGTNLGKLGENSWEPGVAIDASGTIVTRHWSYEPVRRIYSLILRRYNVQ